MNHVERFHRVMNVEPADRLPAIGWAGWPEATLQNKEGWPATLFQWEAAPQ